MLATIQNIVFDIGRVLINLHFDRIEAFLRQHNSRSLTLKDFYRMTAMDDFEHGDIDEHEFISRMQTLFDTPPSRDELNRAFLDIFSPNQPILALADSLKPHYRLYILSNTNILHWRHLHETYDLGNRVHGVVTSFKVRAMKPTATIYRHAERRFDLDPRTTLFIDDLAENAQGAEACGWQAIHHTDNNATLAALTRLGVHTG